MAAATTIIAAGSAALSAGTGIAGYLSQGKQARKYQEQIENYERQKSVNPYADLQVSTLKANDSAPIDFISTRSDVTTPPESSNSLRTELIAATSEVPSLNVCAGF